ncbi:MAG: hypothetical protein K1X89_20190 [Myxococcaceae bacterium]|nr:hypothetical protein [Myxococcaceae bacterium]
MRALSLGLVVLAASAQASQFVILDITYNHSGQGSEPSHKHVQPPYPGGVAPPSNWLSPVDYAHGKAHFRLEVMTKPSNVVVNYETCFVQPTGYGCMGAYGFTKVGVYEWEKSLPNMWQYTAIDWAKNAVQNEIAMVVKDANYNKIETNDPSLYPMQLRYTITILSPGSTYVPPAADAGVKPDAGLPVDAGQPTPDAGHAHDAGSTFDAGAPLPDAGAPFDAGVVAPVEDDAGSMPIEQQPPVTPPPTMTTGPGPDAGVPAAPMDEPAGGCSTAGAASALWLAAVWLRRRRPR